jgi:hypothetical protein
MCPHHPDTHQHTDNDDARDAGEKQPGATPPSARAVRRAGVTVRVERIETEPMTAEEYRRAVIALAAVINEWKSQQPNPPGDHKQAA